MADDSKLDQAKDALARDLEQTKADLPGLDGKDIGQELDDTVKQAAGKEAAPPVDQPDRG
jgi:hypothetical protein